MNGRAAQARSLGPRVFYVLRSDQKREPCRFVVERIHAC